MRLIVIAVCVLIVGGLAAYAFVRFTTFMSAGNAQNEKMTSTFVPNPSNQTSVTVRGWKRPELEKILTDFRQAYEMPAPSDWTIATRSDNVFAISFPNDIPPKLLYFLVNYLQYPKDFDLAHRLIGVLGRTSLTEACGIPDKKLIGMRAEIYVPANDADYDRVYLRTDDAEIYEIPFTDLVWKLAREARRPRTIEGL